MEDIQGEKDEEQGIKENSPNKKIEEANKRRGKKKKEKKLAVC